MVSLRTTQDKLGAVVSFSFGSVGGRANILRVFIFFSSGFCNILITYLEGAAHGEFKAFRSSSRVLERSPTIFFYQCDGWQFDIARKRRHAERFKVNVTSVSNPAWTWKRSVVTTFPSKSWSSCWGHFFFCHATSGVFTVYFFNFENDGVVYLSVKGSAVAAAAGRGGNDERRRSRMKRGRISPVEGTKDLVVAGGPPSSSQGLLQSLYDSDNLASSYAPPVCKKKSSYQRITTKNTQTPPPRPLSIERQQLPNTPQEI